MFLFRLDPIGSAIGTAIISCLGLIGSYLAVHKTLGKTSAIIFTTLLSFSLVNVRFARFSWNPNLLPVFSFFSIYFFYKMIVTRKISYALLFGMFASLSFQLHYLMVFPIIIFGILSILYLAKSRFQLIKNLGAAAFSFIFFLSPLILFDIKHRFINSKSLITLISTGTGGLKTTFTERLSETVLNFFTHGLQTSLSTSAAYVFLAIIAFLLLIFNKKLAKQERLFIFINSLMFFGYLFSFSLLNSFRHPHYYGVIYYSFYILLAYILSCLVKINRTFILLIIIGIFLYSYNNILQFEFLSGIGNHQIKVAKEIAMSIVEHKPQAPFQLTTYPYSGPDNHVRYFVELLGNRPLAEESLETPKELIVLCYDKKCPNLYNHKWQISNFNNAKAIELWSSRGITIYKLIHAK